MNTKVVQLYARLNQALENGACGRLERRLLADSCSLLLQRMSESETLGVDEAIKSVDQAAMQQLARTQSGSAEEEAVLRFVELTARLAIGIFKGQRMGTTACWGAGRYSSPTPSLFAEELFVH